MMTIHQVAKGEAVLLRSFLLRCCAPLFAAMLGGCFNFSGPPSTTIEASDSGVFVPTVRASVGFRGDGVPSEPRSGHGLEVGWSSASGDDQQTLGAGQPPVRFGTQTFSAPTQLSHEFDYRFFEVAYRFRQFFGGDFGIEALAGFAHANLDLSVSSPTQRASESVDSGGVTASFGIIGRLRPSTSVQGRATLFAGSNSGVTAAQRFELYLVQSVWRHAALRAGYVYWNIESEREDTSTSPIKVRFSGPSLGLDLMF
jgi:hypothetical protein